MRQLLIILALLLSACSGREALLEPQPLTAPGAKVEDVLVATTRGPTTIPGMVFDGVRSPTTTYMDFKISVPPDRAPGSLKYPSAVPDPRTEFLSLQQRLIPSERAFLASVNTQLHKMPRGKRTLLVFTHGYNTSFPESVFRLAQIKQDFGFDGASVLFSWPSAASLPLYAYDRDSQLFSRDAFADLISLLTRSDAEEIILLGHSMGGLLTMESIRTLALANRDSTIDRLSGIVLASPDIDNDVFRTQMAHINPRRTPVVVLGDANDRALLISSYVTGGHPRVGGVESIAEMQELGVVFVDTTGAQDAEDLGHSDFATSPTLLALIESGALQSAVVNGKPSNGLLVSAGSLLSNTAAALVYLPVLAVTQ